jgi:hypothetical protein
VVNNSIRTRTVPTASGVVFHGTEFGADRSCRFDQPDIPYEIGEDSWVRIVNGEVQWVVSGCATPGEIGPWTPQPQPQPQPGTGFAFPYAEFWDVPQLGTEPVHGTGCGGDGSLGNTIPDGFWYGWPTGVNGTSLQFDVGCMYHGPIAQQMCNEFTAENPGYGSPPCWGSGADAQFLVNDSTRTRTVPLASTFTAADAEWVDNGDGTQSCVPTPNTNEMNGGMGVWLYIENGEAQYSLRECAHD